MAVSSYGSATHTSGVVRILKDLDLDLTGRRRAHRRGHRRLGPHPLLFAPQPGRPPPRLVGGGGPADQGRPPVRGPRLGLPGVSDPAGVRGRATGWTPPSATATFRTSRSTRGRPVIRPPGLPWSLHEEGPAKPRRVRAARGRGGPAYLQRGPLRIEPEVHRPGRLRTGSGRAGPGRLRHHPRQQRSGDRQAQRRHQLRRAVPRPAHGRADEQDHHRRSRRQGHPLPLQPVAVGAPQLRVHSSSSSGCSSTCSTPCRGAARG